jgi:predicted nucleotidyltransferase
MSNSLHGRQLPRDVILNSMETVHVNAIVKAVADWALRREDIRAMALVGSWARGDPHQGSDVDLLLLTDRADEYRNCQKWLAEIDLESAGYGVASREVATYGVAWSCHVAMSPNEMLELTFARRSWARADTVDEGTRCVVKDAFRVIFDKDGTLTKLVSVVISN